MSPSYPEHQILSYVRTLESELASARAEMEQVKKESIKKQLAATEGVKSLLIKREKQVGDLEREYEEFAAHALKLVEALEDILILHNNESTNKTCCEMSEIAERALKAWGSEGEKG